MNFIPYMKRVRCKLQSRPDRLNKIKIDTIEFQTTSSEKESRLQEQENIVGETKRKEDRFGEKRIASKKKKRYENTRDEEV